MDRVRRRILPSTTAITAFDAVARLGSFTTAAATLNLTVGAVSRQLDLLEKRLGVALLIRTNKGVKLTDKGKRYAEGCADLIHRMSMMSLDVMAPAPENRLNLSILPAFGARWLLPRIHDFVQRHPTITLNIVTRMDPFDLERDGVDAAIHVGHADWPGAVCDLIFDETLVPVCSPAFRDTHRLVEPRDMLTLPLLEAATRPHAWAHWFDFAGVTGEYRPGMRMEHFLNISQACCDGLGIALLPDFLIETELQSGKLVKAFDLSVASKNSYYFVYRKGSRNIDAVMAFRDWIQAQSRA